MKSSFCIDLQRFMLIPTKFPLTQNQLISVFMNIKNEVRINSEPHICVLSVYKSSKLTTCSLGFLFSFF